MEPTLMSLRLPSDAYNFGDELFNRAKESVETASLLPLLKDELRCKIQTKRMSQGLEELKVDFHIKPPMPLTSEETKRQNSRKEDNRYSAKKCRSKKKLFQTAIQQELRQLLEENRDLKESLRCIELEKDRYISKLVQHPVIKKVLTEFSNSSKTSVTELVYQEN